MLIFALSFSPAEGIFLGTGSTHIGFSNVSDNVSALTLELDPGGSIKRKLGKLSVLN